MSGRARRRNVSPNLAAYRPCGRLDEDAPFTFIGGDLLLRLSCPLSTSLATMEGWHSWGSAPGTIRCARCAAPMRGGERHVCSQTAHTPPPPPSPRERQKKAVGKTSTSPIARDVMYRNHVKSLSSYSYSSTSSGSSSSSASPGSDKETRDPARALQTVPEIPEWSQRRASSRRSSPAGVHCGTCDGVIRAAGCLCVADGGQPSTQRPPAAKAGGQPSTQQLPATKAEPSTSPPASPEGTRVTKAAQSLEDAPSSRRLARPSSVLSPASVLSPVSASVSAPASPSSCSSLPRRSHGRDETPAGRRICSPTSPAGRRVDATPAQRSPSAVDAAIVQRSSSEPTFEPARPAHPYRRRETDWRTVVSSFSNVQTNAIAASKRGNSPGDERGTSSAAEAARQPLDGPDDCDDVGGGHWSMGVRPNVANRPSRPRSLTPGPPPRPVAVKRGQHDADAPVWQTNDAYPTVHEQSRQSSLHVPLFLQGQWGSSS